MYSTRHTSNVKYAATRYCLRRMQNARYFRPECPSRRARLSTLRPNRSVGCRSAMGSVSCTNSGAARVHQRSSPVSGSDYTRTGKGHGIIAHLQSYSWLRGGPSRLASESPCIGPATTEYATAEVASEALSRWRKSILDAINSSRRWKRALGIENTGVLSYAAVGRQTGKLRSLDRICTRHRHLSIQGPSIDM
jgi:hypothetical protein